MKYHNSITCCNPHGREPLFNFETGAGTALARPPVERVEDATLLTGRALLHR